MEDSGEIWGTAGVAARREVGFPQRAQALAWAAGGETGAQLLLGLGNPPGEATAIPGELLPGSPAGGLGWSCPDSQEMDRDLLREANLETEQHRRVLQGAWGRGREREPKQK